MRRPSDRLNFNLRVDHALNKAHTLRGSFQQNDNDLRNLGVGNYDLPDRAYRRGREREPAARSRRADRSSRLWFAESRLQIRRGDERHRRRTFERADRARARRVHLRRRAAGGRPAQHRRRVRDRRRLREAAGTRCGWAPSSRAGVYRSDNRTNYLGTFTFPSLADYDAGRPATYTRRVGQSARRVSRSGRPASTSRTTGACART